VTKIIMAEIHIRDVCDPSSSGDCAPLIRVPGSSDIEDLVAEHGVVFEDPGELVSLEPAEGSEGVGGWGAEGVRETPELELLVEVSEDLEGVALSCPLEPDLPWNDSVCRDVTGLDEDAVLLIRHAVMVREGAK